MNIPASITKRYIQPLLQVIVHKWETDNKHCLLLNCHLFLAKISIAVDSITRQAVDIISLSSSFCNGIHILARYVALKRICKQGCGFTLSKTISFLLSHIAQQTTLTPVSIKLFSFHIIPCSQVPNIWITLLGFCRPKVVWIILQINLVIWHSKKRCYIVSLLLQ